MFDQCTPDAPRIRTKLRPQSLKLLSTALSLFETGIPVELKPSPRVKRRHRHASMAHIFPTMFTKLAYQWCLLQSLCLDCREVHRTTPVLLPDTNMSKISWNKFAECAFPDSLKLDIHHHPSQSKPQNRVISPFLASLEEDL